MVDDPTEELAQLRDELDKTAQRYERAESKTGPTTAGDDSGAVKVTIDEAGVVQDVKVVSTWQRSLEPAALGPAVLGAIAAAGLQRLEAWTTQLVEQDREPEPLPRPPPTATQEMTERLAALTAGPSDASTTAALEELLQMAKMLNDGIDSVTSQVTAYLATEFVGRSGSAHVRATVTGAGTIVSLSYDERWLPKAHHTNIGRESVEAIRDARQKAASHDMQAIFAASPLGELQALADDPKALLERLRLLE